MHALDFIQDLAVIMLIAGLVTILFHRLKQPVVLGYLLAGVIIGPHTPPFGLISDAHTVNILAELGVVFLMFSLGLEFSLRKLGKVGVTAFISAIGEISLMLWIGYEIGQLFDWSQIDSIFLGAILSISSTTIIVKALDELGLKQERFAQLIFGVLIVEDILAVGMIALLSGVAISGSVDAQQAFATVGKLSVFMVVALVIGILTVPRLLAYVATFESNEMLLVSVLGLCFGFCLLVVKLNYSIALGAFLIGAIMAESRQVHAIEHLIEPLRDMFSAIFFVTVGLMIDPRVLVTYAVPIVVITIAVVIGKVVACSIGAFVTGQDGKTSLRVGMGLAQIGEFSFIIAAMGLTLKVTSDFLYPIAVAVSALTTLLTPYLIRLAHPLAAALGAHLPKPLARGGAAYTDWLHSLKPTGDSAQLAGIVRKSLLLVLVNLALVAAIFLLGRYLFGLRPVWLTQWVGDRNQQKTVIWALALFLSLPWLIAAYRKLKALSLLLAELSVPRDAAGAHSDRIRQVVAEGVPALSLVGILVLIILLSAAILPPFGLMLLVLGAGAALAALLWRWFVRLQARLQIALIDTLNDDSAPR